MNMVYISVGVLLFVWGVGSYYRQQRNRGRIVCVDGEGCTGCGRCVKRCRRGVLDMEEDEEGKYVVVKYPEKCTACGDCLGGCKFRALSIEERV